MEDNDFAHILVFLYKKKLQKMLMDLISPFITFLRSIYVLAAVYCWHILSLAIYVK